VKEPFIATLACVLFLVSAARADQGSAAANTRTTLAATSVYRGVEEPGRYDVSKLFDGDAETSFCGAGRARVTINLSDLDAAALARVTGVRVTPSHRQGARRISLWFHYRDPARGAAYRKVERALGAEPETLALVASNEPSPNGIEIEVHLEGDGRSDDRRPICLADLTFEGGAGRLDLPGLTVAVHEVAARDAQLARLANDRRAFVRAYLTSFEWVLLNPDKERSDWESASYHFRDDGTYDSTTPHLFAGLARISGRWSVDKGGAVRLDGGARKLEPCSHRPGYLCFSESFFPTAAW
jgi:hypothetical protein